MQKKYTMKKFKLFLTACFMLGTLFSSAQITFLGSEEYGRIFHLVYDQNVENRVYAASMNNHILISNDNAVTWDVLYSLPSGFINELRMLNNTHLSFALKNANVAENNTIHLFDLFTQTITTINRPQNNDSSDRWIDDYNIYESDTDIMLYNEGYRVGFDTYDRVHYTTDGGQTWTLVYDEASNNLISVDKSLINHSNPNQLFITRGNGANGVNGGFLVSHDAGITWTEYFADINFRGVAVDPFDADHWIIGSDPGWGDDEVVYQTLDGGTNWNELTVPFDTYWDKAVNEIIFHPTNQDEIFILETNEIVISYDGGVTWTSYIHESFDPTNYYFGLSATFNPFDVDEMLFTSNWYPHRSTDGGITLDLVQTPYSFTTSVAVSHNEGAEDPFLYYGIQGGVVAKNLTDDSETAYGVQGVDIASGSAPPMFFVDKNQYGRLFSSVEDFNGRALNVSTDNGQTFQMFYTGFWDPVLHMQPDAVNTNEVWVSFDVFSGSGTKIIDVTSADPWSPTIIDITVPTEERHYSTWVDPSNNQNVLIGIGGEVWSSSDRGTTWSNVSAGLNLNVTSQFVFQILNNANDANEFVLATSNGVWKSTDGATTWNQVLATNNVQKVAYDPNNPDIIVAATYASQVSETAIYFSTDNGTTWTMVPATELLYSTSVSMAFDFLDDGTGVTTYLSTSDLGIIAYDVLYQTLSVETPTLDTAELLIYPNPVKDVMNIALEPGAHAKSVVIYNMLGAQVKQVNQASQIDISDLNSGVYLVKVTDSLGKHIVKRIIKR